MYVLFVYPFLTISYTWLISITVAVYSMLQHWVKRNKNRPGWINMSQLPFLLRHDLFNTGIVFRVSDLFSDGTEL